MLYRTHSDYCVISLAIHTPKQSNQPLASYERLQFSTFEIPAFGFPGVRRRKLRSSVLLKVEKPFQLNAIACQEESVSGVAIFFNSTG
jgi:hypothetical protein